MNMGYKLKKGDHVVMHTCMEHDHPNNFGRIWVCRSDEFQHKGHNYGSVMLEGFSGSFSTEFLQKVNVEVSVTEAERLRKELEELRDINEGIRRVSRYWHESFVGLRDALHKIADGEWEESMDGHFNDVFITSKCLITG